MTLHNFLVSLSAPLGIAIGIAAYFAAYRENSPAALASIGILDAFAAGILIYDGIVYMLAPHFNSSNFLKSSLWKQGSQFMSLWLGAFVMAVIGIWA
jgi:zinc transporter 1/2/3